MSSPAEGAGSYPVDLDLDAPLEITWWRAVANPILAIPHLMIMSALVEVLEPLWIVMFFAILFTGAIPKGLFNFTVMILRYSWRVTSYTLFMREGYPPFSFTPSETDPRDDPAFLEISRPSELSRIMIFIKWFVLIPQFIVLAFVALVAAVMVIIGWFSVLLTGTWPRDARDFVLGTIRWCMRVTAYFYLLTDEYPPFSSQR